MLKNLTFVQYSPDYRRELEQMVLALYREDPGEGLISKEKIRSTIQELSKHTDKGTIYLFMLDKSIVGYSIVIWFWSNEFGGDIATVDEIYVKPEWQKNGFGAAFIRFLQNHKDPAPVALQLEVTPGNQRAYNLYLKAGFKPDINRHLFLKL